MNRNKDRGQYKPSSYRFSEETKLKLKELAYKFGSQEEALQHLLALNDKHNLYITKRMKRERKKKYKNG